jgi:hypothetical protein
MRRAAKKDLNHNTIANALRDVGYRVAETHQIGAGFPDLVIGGVHRTTGQPGIWLIEVKDKTGKLTPSELSFHQEWIGYVHIVRTVDDAYKLVGVLQ